jgi:ribonuclease HII
VKSKNRGKSLKIDTKTAMSRKFRGKTRVSIETYNSYDEREISRFNKEITRQCRFLVGVDEAGRGPLAGPVAVGVAVVRRNFNWKLIPGVGDSKKVSEKNREAIFLRAKVLKKEKKLDFAVVLVSPKIIDSKGITHAVALGITRALKKLQLHPHDCDVRLDGLLKAPREYTHQKTIIKGDAKEKVIGLASIMAKVTRDRTLVRVARTYPKYGFDIHKGYGTERHRTAIKKHGLSPIHRRSFCKQFDRKGR